MVISGEALLPFYIIPPPEQILRQRLVNRGDDPEDIERRIYSCKFWLERAKKSDIDYVYILNEEEGIEPAVAQVIAEIERSELI